jgi:hypothetical protein
MGGKTNPPEKVQAVSNPTLFSLRVVKNSDDGRLITLSEDNVVKTGERIRFETNLHKPGKLYLLDATDEKSFKWWNPAKDGDSASVPKDGWAQIPAHTWVEMGLPVRIQKYWLIYVPEGVDWSLVQAVLPYQLSVKESPVMPPTIPEAQTENLKAFLEEQTIKLGLKPVNNTGVVTYEFSPAAGEAKVASYQFTLRQIP